MDQLHSASAQARPSCMVGNTQGLSQGNSVSLYPPPHTISSFPSPGNPHIITDPFLILTHQLTRMGQFVQWPSLPDNIYLFNGILCVCGFPPIAAVPVESSSIREHNNGGRSRTFSRNVLASIPFCPHPPPLCFMEARLGNITVVV